MAGYLDDSKNKVDKSLAASLGNAESIITKDYLDRLENYEIIPPTWEDIDINVSECGQFYKLSKLVCNKEENFLDKLTTIINVAFSIDSSLTTIIKSDGLTIDYYMGIISKNFRMDNNQDETRRKAAYNSFRGAVLGNLNGSEISDALSKDEVISMQKDIFSKTKQAVSSISGIVALRNKADKNIDTYVQGIENLTDSMRGEKYTIILVADPIKSGKLQTMKQGYEMIYSQLTTFLKSTVSINESNTMTISDSQSNSITKGITEGISRAQSKTDTQGTFRGINAGVSFSPFGIGVSAGVMGGSSNSTATGTTDSISKATSEQTMRQIAVSLSSAKGTGKSLQLNFENRSVKALLNKIDKHLERLEMCESFGAFECATYVIAENVEKTLTISSNYNALMRGEESFVQSSYINTWSKEDDTTKLLKYLNSFVHPKFSSREQNLYDKLVVTPASVISGKEIAIQFGLPKKSISGIPVVQMTPFGRNININELNKNIKLGNLYHMGKAEDVKVKIDVDSLTSHTFITGSTGSGKSNTVYKILNELDNINVPFLVIEPAKGEYKNVFGNRDDVNVFGTNFNKTPMLKINPFKFPEDIHVLEHIDRLIEIFNVCWPMYAAMPAVLKDAIEEAYIASGWNLDSSINCYDYNVFPVFKDILEQLHKVIEKSEFSQEVKSNYIGALVTRVKSLTNGINGQIFVSDEIESEKLFNSNTIVDLSRVASVETKSMIMGILVMKLQEFRMSEGGMNRELRHVTVLEEAHNLLKKTSMEQSSEGSNLLGKSVEMLSNSIAEMRTYGEGFIIADQSPSMLDMSAIRNTNTKIILRLPDFLDRELVGRAASLNDNQIIELSKLSTGVAAVYQNNWLEPILCKMDKDNHENVQYYYTGKNTFNYDKKLKNTIVRCLLANIVGEKIEYNIDDMKERIYNSNLCTNTKLKLIKILEKKELDNINKISSIINDIFRFDLKNIDNAKNMSIDEWNSNILIKSGLEELKLPIVYEDVAIQCLLKEKSKVKECSTDTYEKWTEYMRRKVL